MNKKIGEYLKNRRKSLNLSVKDVVNALSEFNVTISDKTLYGWENDHRQPDADAFLILCKIYDIKNVLQYFGFASQVDTKEPPFKKEEQDLIKKYRALDDRGKKVIDDNLEREYGFVNPAVKEQAAILTPENEKELADLRRELEAE